MNIVPASGHSLLSPCPLSSFEERGFFVPGVVRSPGKGQLPLPSNEGRGLGGEE